MELPDLDGGTVPPGRFRLTLAEVACTWVEGATFSGSTVRRAIWEEWRQAADALRGAVPVCAVWLGGSFISPQLEPGDLDCVWLIDDVFFAVAGMDQQRRDLIGHFAANQLRAVGIRVDSYIRPWRRRPDAAYRDELDQRYARNRGYWDDFWQRTRSAAKGSAPARSDALPRRGYVEVVLDGFPE